MASTLEPIFTHTADFDPAGDFDAFLKLAPPRWVVYLLADSDDRPVQLLYVKNLRNSLKGRLGLALEEQAGPSRRVNYRELVRRVHWRRVDSTFEADWVYYEAARRLFPQTYQGILGFRPAWFVHVDPSAEFPRYTKTTDVGKRAGVFLGPVEDKHAAARLVQLAEDSFDLCRYHHILVEAPHGAACAYKEMGKCPAPCDGSVPMDQYRLAVEASARALVDPSDFVREQTHQMRQAAAGLKFEAAGRIKQRIDHMGGLGKGPFRHVAPLGDFGYLSLQRGPREQTAKVFLITPGRIEEIAGLAAEPAQPADLPRHVLGQAAELAGEEIDLTGVERIGLVTHHLFSAKHRGVFLRLRDIDEGAVAKAWRELKKQSAPEEDAEGEGVVKELQSL